MTPLLDVRHLRKAFGGLVATDDVSLEVRPGEIHALIGPNGAGKSTLISLLFGQLRPDSGSVGWQGADMTRWPPRRRARCGLARSFQITSVFPEFTVRDNVALAIRGRRGRHFSLWADAAADHEVRRQAESCLARVDLADRASRVASTLSYGEQRHLEFAMALALEPVVLLLDEPMAGVGTDESRQLTTLIARLRDEQHVSVLLVEHDMDAVFRLADRLSVLVQGRVVATGSVAEIRRDPVVRAAYLGEGA